MIRRVPRREQRRAAVAIRGSLPPSPPLLPLSLAHTNHLFSFPLSHTHSHTHTHTTLLALVPSLASSRRRHSRVSRTLTPHPSLTHIALPSLSATAHHSLSHTPHPSLSHSHHTLLSAVPSPCCSAPPPSLSLDVLSLSRMSLWPQFPILTRGTTSRRRHLRVCRTFTPQYTQHTLLSDVPSVSCSGPCVSLSDALSLSLSCHSRVFRALTPHHSLSRYTTPYTPHPSLCTQHSHISPVPSLSCSAPTLSLFALSLLLMSLWAQFPQPQTFDQMGGWIIRASPTPRRTKQRVPLLQVGRTLNPKSSTLHPTHYTPTPYTLHPWRDCAHHPP